MFPQQMIDVLVVIGLFILRIGVPLALTVAVGYWLERRLKPEGIPRRHTVRAPNIALPGLCQHPAPAQSQLQTVHCWEVNKCKPEAYDRCAAYRHPELPCWLALQVEGNALKEGCAVCGLYRPQCAVT